MGVVFAAIQTAWCHRSEVSANRWLRIIATKIAAHDMVACET
jgi:hypothetical protein